MKLSLLAGVAVSALILAAPQASAAGYKPYVSVFGGGAILAQNPHGTYEGPSDGSLDLLMNNPGYVFGATVGADWGNHIRTEVELSHARWSSDKYHSYATSDGGHSGTHDGSSSVSATYLLGNVWLDLNQGSRITPYLGGGAGIGWANVNIFPGESFEDNFNSTGFAFQIGAGVRFAVNDHFMIDAGYRFKDIVGLNYDPVDHVSSIDSLSDTSLASHNFQIGLTYSF